MVEVVFVVGPLLTALATGAAVAAWPRWCSPPCWCLAGTLAFTASAAVARVAVRAARRGPRGARARCARPGCARWSLATLPLGFCFGAMEVDAAGVRRGRGEPRVRRACCIAMWSLGSALGGLAYGARAGASARRSATSRLACAAAARATCRWRPPRPWPRWCRWRPRRRRHRPAADGRQPARRRGRARGRDDRGLHLADHARSSPGWRRATPRRARSSRRRTGARRSWSRRAARRSARLVALAGRWALVGRLTRPALGPAAAGLGPLEQVLEPQKASAMRCSPRWRTSRTRVSSSGLAAVHAAPEARRRVAAAQDRARPPSARPGSPTARRARGGRRRPGARPRARRPGSRRRRGPPPAPAALLARPSRREAYPARRRRGGPAGRVSASWRAMPDPLTITVLEGDETGQELLEQALRVLDPDVLGLELELERYDLSLENRRATRNAVVHEAARAMRDSGFGIKAATITPEGEDDVGSPEPHPARGGRRQGHHPHRPPDPRRHAVRRRPPPDLDRAHGRRRRLRRRAVARGRARAPPTRSPTAPRRSPRRRAAPWPSTRSAPPREMGGCVYGGPKWTVSPVYEGMLKEEIDAAAARHPEVDYQPVLIDATYAGPHLRRRRRAARHPGAQPRRRLPQRPRDADVRLDRRRRVGAAGLRRRLRRPRSRWPRRRTAPRRRSRARTSPTRWRCCWPAAAVLHYAADARARRRRARVARDLRGGARGHGRGRRAPPTSAATPARRSSPTTSSRACAPRSTSGPRSARRARAGAPWVTGKTVGAAGSDRRRQAALAVPPAHRAVLSRPPLLALARPSPPLQPGWGAPLPPRPPARRRPDRRHRHARGRPPPRDHPGGHGLDPHPSSPRAPRTRPAARRRPPAACTQPGGPWSGTPGSVCRRGAAQSPRNRRRRAGAVAAVFLILPALARYHSVLRRG